MDEAGTEEDGIASRTKKPTSIPREFRGNYLKIVKHCKANQILGTLWTQMGYTVNIYIYNGKQYDMGRSRSGGFALI